MMSSRTKKPFDITAVTEERRKTNPNFIRGKEIEAPIVADLVSAGYNVEVVSDLHHRRLNYQGAIPILLRWLPQADDLITKEVIVRALSVKWAKPVAAPALIKEFRKAPSEARNLKWAIGNALEMVADDSVFEDLVGLARDRSHGKAREMVVAALANMKDPRAVDVLIQLLDDDEVAGHALVALRKLAPPKAWPYIERFVNHPRTWWRNEAKRAIAKIDKAAEKAKERTEQS